MALAATGVPSRESWVAICLAWLQCEIKVPYKLGRVLARIFAIGGALCIINNFGSLVSNGCGQLHVCELQVAIQRSKAKVSHRPADFIW